MRMGMMLMICMMMRMMRMMRMMTDMIFVKYFTQAYRVSLKKGSFRIPAPMGALGYSKGLDISQKHCQTFFFG